MGKEHTNVGRYEVANELRRDSLSVVHQAHDPLADRDVAIKTLLLPEGLPEDQEEDILAGLRRQAETAGRLSHPAIAVVYEASQGPEPEAAFLAMELIPGSTLEELIAHEGALKADWVLATADTLADALHAAHQAGVFHGDLKPANILIREVDGAPKITEFGKIRVEPQGPVPGGVAVGRAYLAPERIQGQPPDARSDLFSLALVVYEALCGQHAYGGDDFDSTCRAIRHEAPVPIRQRVSDLAPAVDEFLMRALSFDPEERFEDARAFQTAIRDVLLEQQRFSSGEVVALPEASDELASIEALDENEELAIEEPIALQIERNTGVETVALPVEPASADLSSLAETQRCDLPWVEPVAEVSRPVAPQSASRSARNLPPWLAAAGAVLVLCVIVIGWKWGLSRSEPSQITRTLAPGIAAPSLTEVAPQPAAPLSARTESKSPAPSEPSRQDRRTEAAPRPAATSRKAEPAPAPAQDALAPVAEIGSPEAAPVVESAPAPTAPPAEARGAALESFVELHVKSNVKAGTLILLVDGQSVYSTELSADAKTLGRAYKKAVRKAEQEFDARVAIRPGRHTLMARVVTASRTKPLEDTVHFEIEADQVQHVRIVAGRPVGRKLTINLE